ncbi:MAG: J domain-containing protein [Treponema sp.]|nr:J domain-containing protein [Treponema sp.]
MGILDRLGNVIKSYVSGDAEYIYGQKSRSSKKDDDYDAAYEELEGFLKGEKAPGSDDKKSGNAKTGARPKPKRNVPFELKVDFAELGLEPDATEAECKEAYKKLLKIYHPDRHTGDPEGLKKATEKTARINAAFDNLVKWFKSDK